jgi:hypothetical protein
MVFRMMLLGILALMTACSRSPQPPPSAGAPAAITDREVEARWAMMSTSQKRYWHQQSSGSGKDTLRKALEEESGWACLARKEGLENDPVVKVREEDASRKILFEELLRKRAVAALVTEAEIQDHFQKRQMDFFFPEEAEVAHILVGPRKEKELKNAGGDDAEGEAAAKDKINRLNARIQKGEDFFALARQYSEDASAERDGRLGWFGRGVMVKPFEEQAFALPVGGTSEAFRTEYGWHILKVLGRRGGKPLLLAEVRREVEDRILSQKREQVETLKTKLLEEVKRDCMRP